MCTMQILLHQQMMLDSPISGILSAVEGSVSLRISNNTEIDSSKVTLKLSLSVPLASMKKDIRSNTRKKNTGSMMLMTYSRGLLFMVICHGQTENI